MSHTAHHRRAGVNANTDPQRCLQLLHQSLAELAYPAHHAGGRGERLATTLVRPGLHAEQSHDAVAGELIGNPARLLDGTAHNVEVAVQQEHHVIGQFLLGNPRKAPDIGEQYRDLPLLLGQRPGLREPLARLYVCRQQRNHRQGVGRAQLAGEAHVGRGADALEHAQLFGTAWREEGKPLDHPYPARRAATTPAAHRGMRNPGEAARLKYASAHWDHYSWAIGVGHANGLTAALLELTGCPGDKHETNTGGKASHHHRTHTLYDGLLRWPGRRGHP